MNLEQNVQYRIMGRKEYPYSFYSRRNRELERIIRPNPEVTNGPFGKPVPELNVIINGDLHAHIRDKTAPGPVHTFDRTQELWTTKLMNSLRRKRRRSPNHSENWHEIERPKRYNRALRLWPKAISRYLEEHKDQIQPTNNVLIVNSGDLGNSGLHCRNFAMAAVACQEATRQIGQQFGEKWGPGTNVQGFYAAGNHDVDLNPWKNPGKTHQMQWYYGILHENRPASSLQIVRKDGENEGGKALLILDTNLLDKAWLRTVRKAHAQAVKILQSKVPGIAQSDLDAFAANPYLREQFKLKYESRLSQEDPYLEDVLIYPLIQQHIAAQNALIKEAQTYKDVVIVGHTPRDTIHVAEGCEDNATVIAGDLHFSYDSQKAKRSKRIWTLWTHRRTKNGSLVHTYILAAPSKGAIGLEFPNTPSAYHVFISSEKDEITVNEIQLRELDAAPHDTVVFAQSLK